MQRALLAIVLLVWAAGACNPSARRGNTVVFASGADLQSINPLLTVHPLARQVQRYALLTTLVRYDSALAPSPALARAWAWSRDSLTLTLTLSTAVRWHDGTPTTARDARWTLDAARDPVVGYPRQQDVALMSSVDAANDSTLVIRFAEPRPSIPDVLTDLAILPAHLLDTVPRAALRQAAWNEAPVGNGPFRFVRHEPNRKWVFERNPDFPAALGGPPRIERLVIAVVDEPMTKLAALVSGELDFAGIQPAHAAYVRRDPALDVVDYPLLFTYVLVFNTRRPPFDDVNLRRQVAAAFDRQELVDGYVFGFGTPAPRAEAPTRTDLPTPPTHPTLPTPPTLLTVGTSDNALEQLMQAQLARAGITVGIRQLELSAFLDRVHASHDFDLAVMGIPGDQERGYLQSLGDVAGVAVPRDTAAALSLIARDVPATFLYQARGVQGVNRRVRGVRMDTRGELATLADWHVTP